MRRRLAVEPRRTGNRVLQQRQRGVSPAVLPWPPPPLQLIREACLARYLSVGQRLRWPLITFSSCGVPGDEQPDQPVLIGRAGLVELQYVAIDLQLHRSMGAPAPR